MFTLLSLLQYWIKSRPMPMQFLKTSSGISDIFSSLNESRKNQFDITLIHRFRISSILHGHHFTRRYNRFEWRPFPAWQAPRPTRFPRASDCTERLRWSHVPGLYSSMSGMGSRDPDDAQCGTTSRLATSEVTEASANGWQVFSDRQSLRDVNVNAKHDQ